MAKKFENKKGFLIIEMSIKEADSIGFGFEGGACICLGCNNICIQNVYYVAVLNETMCEDCVKDFIENSTRYEEDIPYEERNYKHYSNQLML